MDWIRMNRLFFLVVVAGLADVGCGDLTAPVSDVFDAAGDTDLQDGIDEPPYARFINPFIGTQDGIVNIGNTYPGPGLPFGMIKPGPDTGDEYGAIFWSHCGGYRYADPLIYGFSHTHLHGVGIPDYGDFLVMPVKEVTTARTEAASFASRYDKASERAEAGYYTVKLTDPDVTVELTATSRCGYHRYTWPEGATSGAITIDYGASIVHNKSLGGSVTMAQDGVVEVLNHHIGDFSSVFGGYDIRAVFRFSAVPDGFGVWHDGVVTKDTADLSIPKGEETTWGGWFEFNTREDPVVEVQVCLSYVDFEGARANMAAELADRDFDDVRRDAMDAWEDYVGRFKTVGGDLDRKVNFYTALYHTALMPQLWNDVTGKYRGFDGEVHTTDGWDYYTDLSLWDTFRTQQPLLALVWPEVHLDINRSMLEMARQSGNLPMWALASGDSECMIGQHAATVLADSYLKGIRDYDAQEAFDFLAAAANDTLAEGVRGRRSGAASYNNIGYVSQDQDDASVSVTLEYAFNDFCLAELASALDRPEEEAVFRARAQNYRNVWDPAIRFFRERNADGTWRATAEQYDPTVMSFGGKNQGYTEGSGWQYRWFAPHDPQGLIALFDENVQPGADDDFVGLLNQFFQTAQDTFDFQLPSGYYFHGNEPDIHAPFMFIHAGRPDLTQYWTRWILDTNYRNQPEGLVGNDDAGTLAAWYVFVAAGLYPSPCRPGYFITTPAFDQVTINLPGGDLVVEAPGASGDAMYITSATFNGEPIDMDAMWIDHETIRNGGTLSLTVTSARPGH